jgi:hypothetical protein
VVGTILLAFGGALVGSMGGLAWCKPEDLHRARQSVALLTSILLGGIVGLGVCMVGYRNELQYPVRIVFHGEQMTAEPLEDANGHLRLWLFSYQVYERVGPADEMILWQRRLQWYVLAAFVMGGAGLGLLGFKVLRRTKHQS